MELRKISGYCFSVLSLWGLQEVEELKKIIALFCKLFMLNKSICLVVKEPHRLSLGFDFGMQIHDNKNRHLCTYVKNISMEQIIAVTLENEEFISSSMRFLIFDEDEIFCKENFDQYLDVLYGPELGKYKSLFVNHDANSFYLYNFSREEILNVLTVAGEEYVEKFAKNL